jgi:hypothetical protein
MIDASVPIRNDCSVERHHCDRPAVDTIPLDWDLLGGSIGGIYWGDLLGSIGIYWAGIAVNRTVIDVFTQKMERTVRMAKIYIPRVQTAAAIFSTRRCVQSRLTVGNTPRFLRSAKAMVSKPRMMTLEFAIIQSWIPMFNEYLRSPIRTIPDESFPAVDFEKQP